MPRKPYNLLILCLLLLNFWVFWEVKSQNSETAFYFLDVGQGDATLFEHDGVRILTDAGPQKEVLSSLSRVLPAGSKHLDLGIITHEQLDHFNGFNFILDEYSLGAILWNGRLDRDISEWKTLTEKVEKKGVSMIPVSAGDIIRKGNAKIKFLAPSPEFNLSGEWNDTSLVAQIQTPELNVLLTGDIGFNVENMLLNNGLGQTDVLKIPHHGSRFSSSEEFLSALQPKVSVIQVGEKNTYGHPAPAVLEGLRKNGSLIFRTDQNGTIKIINPDNRLIIYAERP